VTRDLSSDFGGTDRFRIEARLGAGGMGVVYRAFDRVRDQRVALKTLREIDAAAIYRLKREFRALADLRHRNLVALHELVSVGSQWFFTMELVEGIDLLTWIRSGPAVPDLDQDDRQRSLDFAREPTDPALTALPETGPVLGPEQLDRLRAGFVQLAEGVAALHEAGKLHRDIKPPNCLVTRDGRAVLLDFGLVAELEHESSQQSTEHRIVGTASYMSPEQAASLPLGPASDWYSVGVILYEALTSRLPFAGRTLEVLMEKQRREPTTPRSVAPGVPDDLDELCVALLRLKPEDRPPAREILRRLGAATAVARPQSSPPVLATHNLPFLGREFELAALRDAFQASMGHAVTVFVHGSSGVGKSALCRRFLDNLVAADEAVVLTGRCYESESLPFKAVDSLIDALSRYLARLPRLEAEAVMPRDVLLLARIFPVLRRVESVASHRGRALDVPNPQELRRRAFGALRELFARLADRRPLVLAIDNLQWGDLDSAALLTEVLRPPEPPPLLLLASYRSEDAETSALIKALRRLETDVRTGFVDVRTVGLDPLSPYDTRVLALTLLGEEGAEVQRQAEAIAAESHGNPYFLIELVRSVQAGAEERGPAAGPITLDEVIRARVARLPADAQRLLEVIAVAGRPVPQAVVGAAAELAGEPLAALRMLRAANLVHTRGTHETDPVECYHDRIRAAVVAGLEPPWLRAHHRRLAMRLSASDQADPEALVVHYRGAGDHEQAAHYAAVAAAKAAEALAFDRAAHLYRLTLDLGRGAGPEGQAQRINLGDALANAGRGADAAAAYLGALPGATAAARLDLQRRAAEQLLKAGYIDDGLAAVREVLAAVGMRYPSARTALLQLGWLRARVRLRAGRYRERDVSQVAAEELTRCDVCWSMNTGLAFVDPVRGAIFQARHQLLALASGEPSRVALALAAEVCYRALAGSRGAERNARLLARADQLAQRLGDPLTQAMCELAAAMSNYLLGRWRAGRDLARQAETTLRERCTGAFVVWHLANVQLVNLWARTLLGDVRGLPGERARLLTEAEQRGDVYFSTALKTGEANFSWLVNDDVDGARRAAEDAESQWTRQGYNLQHYDSLYALGNVDLYVGDGRGALRRMRDGWAAIKRSHLMSAQIIRGEVYFLRARAALMVAASLPPGSERAALLREAAADAGRLAREEVAWIRAQVAVLRAGVAWLDGDEAAARAHLDAAVAGFDAVEMALHAAAARRRRGALVGGAAGQADRDAADRVMRAEMIANPAAMTLLWAPGFPD
jgi:serine/threonine protein kinase